MTYTPPLRDGVSFDHAQAAHAFGLARRANRRRLIVFLLVFALTLVPGLIWNLSRPAEYRASARVQVTAGTVSANLESVTPVAVVQPDQQHQKPDLLTQAQLLTSRSLLEEVMQRLARDGHADAFSGADPVGVLQNAIVAVPVAGTDIVEVQAVGASPLLMAKTVNTLIATYREHLFSDHDAASQEAIVNLREEVERLGAAIAEKRAKLAAFRTQSGVVSSERSENQALARAKGLGESLNKASEDAAKADARLRTLRESAAMGKSPVFSKDNPTLAAIEQRISTTREQLRDMERTYTPAFMAMDPTAIALRARLAELEQQLSASRLSSQQAALAAAEEEASGARATVERLRAQIDGQRREALVFSGNFQDAKAMEEDLTRLEGTRRNAAERLAKLDASERARHPTLKLLEAASVPQQAWRPDYLRDGMINLAISFVLGLLAVWFVELFNRSPAMPAGATTVVVPQPWLSPALGMEAAQPRLALDAVSPALPPPSAAALPRELDQDEVSALLAAANDDGRLLCGLLLLGLSVDELCQLKCRDVDVETGRLTVRGVSARTLPLPAWLTAMLEKCGADDADSPLLRNSQGLPLDAAEVAARLTCAAIDARLAEAGTVSAPVLRHTYIANLVRQNVRFSDLASLAGAMGAEELAAYSTLATGGAAARADEVDPIMPSLRRGTVA